MSRRIIGVVLAVSVMLFVFAGCGAGRSANSTAAAAPAARASMDVAPAAEYAAEQQAADQAASSHGSSDTGNSEVKAAASGTGATGLVSTEGGGSDAEVDNAILAERKIIRSANVTVEVADFDEAYGKINNLLLGIGFIQDTNINTNRVYVGNELKLVRSGTIVVRVDEEKFDQAFNNIKGIGDVYNWSINGQDVTDKYMDTESRIRQLKLEQTKLEEYLSKTTDLDQIFKIEGQLTDVRQEIESLTGNLNKLSSLVQLSTITININEKSPGQVTDKPKTYGQRLMSNLMDTLEGVVKFFGEVVIILVAALPVLIILGLFILVIVFIYKRIPRKKNAGSLKEAPEEKKDGEA